MGIPAFYGILYGKALASRNKNPYLRTSFEISRYFGEVAEDNEALPSFVVHNLFGRNYSVYPFACGERGDYCTLSSV